MPSVLRTISLKATTHSRVARFSFRRLNEAYENDPAAWSRSLKIIISRFLHVTLTPLHQHLGLSEELFKRVIFFLKFSAFIIVKMFDNLVIWVSYITL